MVGNSRAKKAKDVVRRRLSLGTKEIPQKYSPDLEKCPANEPDLSKENSTPRYIPTDWDDSLPYGGKVYLARKKKPESWLCIILQVLLVGGAVGLMYYGWYYTEHLHFHTTKLFASLGHKNAQAIIGHKLLHGKGVEKDHNEAMKWLYEAAKQGHPHSAYNVAVGHLQGLKTNINPGELKEFIKHAADNGVEEAVAVYERVCLQGKCDI